MSRLTARENEDADPEAWVTYRRKVVETLDALVKKYDLLHDEVINLKIKVAVFASLWAIAGTVGTHFIIKLIDK